MKNKNNYQSKEYLEWKEFSNQFLNLVELVCKTFEDNCTNEESKEKYDASDFYIATVYNMKHTIEICIKTYIRCLDEEVKFGGDLGHDTKKLFAYLRKKFTIQEIINSIDKLDDKEEYGFVKNSIKKNVVNKNRPIKLEEIIKKTEDIIERYFDLKKLNASIYSHLTINDYNNTFFKYPENDIDCNFRYKNFLAGIKTGDILKIKDDVDIVRNNLFVLVEILHYYRETKNNLK